MSNNYFPVILAGGFGTRTKDILAGKPKALIVASDGKTLLEHLLFDLQNNGFTKALIVTNSVFFEQIKEHVNLLESNGLTICIQLINNGVSLSEKRLGALGDLFLASKNIDSNQSLLVFASDYAYWKSFSVGEIVSFASKNIYSKNFITLTRKVENRSEIAGRYGCPEVDENGFVVSFAEKPLIPKSNLATIAFYIYRPNHLELLNDYKNKGGNMDSPSNFIPFLIQKNEKVVAMVVKNITIDAGTPKEIEEARNY